MKLRLGLAAFFWGGVLQTGKEAVAGMKKRALRIAGPVVVACLVAGSIVAFFVGNGSLSGGEWKTAAGVSLQLPAAGSPKLVFTAQPATGQAVQAGGGVFTVTVVIEDSHGTTLTSDSTDTITLALSRNPGHGVLSCSSSGGLTAPVDLGRATFSGCSISKPGIGYRLTARSSVKPALAPPANGHTFAVLSAAAAKAAANAAARTTALKVAQAGGRNQTVATAGPATGPGTGGGPNPGSTPAGAGLVITSPAVTGAATARPDLGPITVELVTAGGTPATTGVTMQLSSSSTGASEFSASAGGKPGHLHRDPARRIGRQLLLRRRSGRSAGHHRGRGRSLGRDPDRDGHRGPGGRPDLHRRLHRQRPARHSGPGDLHRHGR